MPNHILDGLSLVDATGRAILVANIASLLAGVGAHLFLRARYESLEDDLAEHSGERHPQFTQRVLERIVRQAGEAARRPGERNTQAIIEERFQSDLGPLLLAERFVRAATGLVIILGLLGTFYGLTLSIGKLVALVSSDGGVAADVTQAVTHGLTEALAGMAVAFSNSLVGIVSAVVLTVLGVLSNVTDRRTALMVRIETYLDGLLADTAAGPGGAAGSAASFEASVARLEGAVARFQGALQSFAAHTRDLREIELVVSLKPRDEP